VLITSGELVGDRAGAEVTLAGADFSLTGGGFIVGGVWGPAASFPSRPGLGLSARSRSTAGGGWVDEFDRKWAAVDSAANALCTAAAVFRPCAAAESGTAVAWLRPRR